jgi:hypothetical protein
MTSDDLAAAVGHEAANELASALARIHHCLGQLTDEQIWHRPGLGAIFDSVPHFRGHTQEIVHRTRSQLGDAYRFAWAPATAEQGA